VTRLEPLKLGWALHDWGNHGDRRLAEPYYEVGRQLVAAGARVENDWVADEWISSDPEMVAALRQEERH
jgi:hypothetical protein